MVSAKQATPWWSKRFIWAISSLFACAFLLTSCDPVLPQKMCTLVGCIGGVSIDIADLPSGAEYQVNLILPSGEMITQVCDANPEASLEKSCNENGVFIALPTDVDPPESITIEVVVDGQTYTKDFTPIYEEFQPNGEGCPPICYNADVLFQIMQ